MDCNYVQEAAEYVRARIGETPRIGLILAPAWAALPR